MANVQVNILTNRASMTLAAQRNRLRADSAPATISLYFCSLVCLTGLALSPFLGPGSFAIRISAVLAVNLAWIISVFLSGLKVSKGHAAYLFFYISTLAYLLVLNSHTEYGVVGVANQWTMYFGLIPVYFLLSFLVRSGEYKKVICFLDFNFLLIFFILIGVVLDGLINLNNLLGLSSLTRLDEDSLMRASFLLSSPTAIFILIASGLLVALSRSYRPVIVFTYFTVSFLAAWLTYSRFPLLLLFILTVFLAFRYFFYSTKKSVVYFIVAFLLSSVVYLSKGEAIFEGVSDSYGKLFSTLSVSDKGNEERINSYRKFFYGPIAGPERVLGRGAGSSSINLARLFDMDYLGHYESSLLAMLSEIGVVIPAISMVFVVAVLLRALELSSAGFFILFLMFFNILLTPLYNGYMVPYLFSVSIFISINGGLFKRA